MSGNCGCEGKKYNISLGCCQPVLAPVENFYNRWQIDEMLEEIESAITSGCCITPEEVDEKIEEAISGITPCDLSQYWTSAQTESAITSAMTVVEGKIPSLSGYATEQWVENKGYLTEHQPIKTINGQSLIGTGDIEIGTGGTIDLSNYYTTAETKSLVESAVTRVEGEMPSLNGYATEQWVLDKHYISGVDLSDYALKSEIPTVPTSNTAFTNDAGYLTQHQSLSGYATEQWVLDKHYISGVDLSDYALKSEIPVVPTSNTAFTNDAGYLTEHQSLSAYSTTQEVTNLINQSVSGKQDTLSAGTNITIVDNVISATGGGGSTYTPSSGISISNNEISTRIGSGLRYAQDGTLEVNSTNAIASGNTQVPLSYVVYTYVNNNCMMRSQIWCGTQTQYDAITTKDNNVIYLIHE